MYSAVARVKKSMGEFISFIYSYGCLIVLEGAVSFVPEERVLNEIKHAADKFDLHRLDESPDDIFNQYVQYDKRGISREEILRAIKSGEICLLSIQDNRISGALWISLKASPFSHLSKMNTFLKNKAYMLHIFISEEQRGSGLAPLLLSEGTKILHAMGTERTATIINYHNKPSLGLFKKMGFAPRYRLRYFRLGSLRKHIMSPY